MDEKKKLKNENEVEDLYGGDRIRRDGKVYKILLN